MGWLIFFVVVLITHIYLCFHLWSIVIPVGVLRVSIDALRPFLVMRPYNRRSVAFITTLSKYRPCV